MRLDNSLKPHRETTNSIPAPKPKSHARCPTLMRAVVPSLRAFSVFQCNISGSGAVCFGLKNAVILFDICSLFWLICDCLLFDSVDTVTLDACKL